MLFITLLILLLLMTVSTLFAYLGFVLFLHKTPNNPIMVDIDWQIFGGMLTIMIGIYMSITLGFVMFSINNDSFLNYLYSAK